MTLPVLIGVALAGGAGAVGRLLLDSAVSSSARSFPLGTFVVNLTGAFALGVIVGLAASGQAQRYLATGLTGGFTTFSTWMFESQRLAEDRESRLGVVNLALSLVLGVVAAWAGSKVGAAL
jgi:CrcB protein